MQTERKTNPTVIAKSEAEPVRSGVTSKTTRSVGVTSTGQGWPIQAAFFDPHPERELYIPPHQHHKLILVVKPVSRLDLTVGAARRSGRVFAGDMILMSARTPSVWHWSERASILRLQIPTAWVERIALESNGRTAPYVQLKDRLPFRDPSLESVSRELLNELRLGAGASRLCVDSLATVLVVHMLRRHNATAVLTGESSSTANGLAPWRLRRTLDYLDAHLTEETSLVDLAAVAGLSPYHFGKLFKRSTGQSPHVYVVNLRITRAKSLLSTGRKALSEIATECGFSSQNHFTSTFHRAVGVTPGRFRSFS